MIRNYFKTAIRSLIKNKVHTFINIAGLSFGIACSIIIFLVVRFELSFDTYHDEVDRTYRVLKMENRFGREGYDTGIPYPMFETLKEDLPEIELMTIVDANSGQPLISVTRADGSVDRFLEREDGIFAMPDYFRIFKYEWIAGDAQTALEGPKTVVISDKIANKIFPDQSPIGKVINLDNFADFTVTGVVKATPENTDIPFNLIVSHNIGEERGWDEWNSTSSSVQCYLRLRENVDVAAFEEKLSLNHLKYWEEEEAKSTSFFTQPMSDLHFNTRYSTFGGRNVSFEMILSLSLIGLFLLITACINFVNLNTALIVNRSKEVGVRKTLGGNRHQLILQFLGETGLITLMSILVAVGLVEITLLRLDFLLSYSLDFAPLADHQVFTFILILFLAVNLLAGLYPAFALSGFKPIQALKNKQSQSYKDGLSLRKTLIIVQLFITQGLIICTIIVNRQMDLFLNSPTGVDTEAVLEFSVPDTDSTRQSSLKAKLREVKGIENYTISNTGATSSNTWGGDFTYKNGDEIIRDNAKVKFIDENYIDTYGLKLLYGENVEPLDSVEQFLINEKLAFLMGFDHPEEAIGEEVKFWGRTANIRGVIKDFNANSLKENIRPLIFSTRSQYHYWGAVKIRTNDFQQVINDVDAAWSSVFSEYVFDYKFLDTTIAEYYEDEKQVADLFLIFSCIAVFIGCMGLYGLISFLVAQRTKEVGVRKVLGASVNHLVWLFSNQFMVLVLLAFVVAAPLAYYIMSGWLEDFAYKIELSFWVFALGAIITMFIVVMTVGYKSFRAALANPVDVLRDE
ncbi:MAG: ABC transporter permease [Bacteroidota bacterium]